MLAVSAEDRSRIRATVDNNTVPCVAALALMAYDTCRYACKTSDAAAAVYFNSFHIFYFLHLIPFSILSVSRSGPPALLRDFLESAGSALIIGFSGVLIIT